MPCIGFSDTDTAEHARYTATAAWPNDFALPRRDGRVPRLRPDSPVPVDTVDDECTRSPLAVVGPSRHPRPSRRKESGSRRDRCAWAGTVSNERSVHEHRVVADASHTSVVDWRSMLVDHNRVVSP